MGKISVLLLVQGLGTKAHSTFILCVVVKLIQHRPLGMGGFST